MSADEVRSAALGGILEQLHDSIAERGLKIAHEQEPLDGTETQEELAAFRTGLSIGVFMAAEAYEIHSGQILAEFLPGTFAAPSRTELTEAEFAEFESNRDPAVSGAHQLVAWLVEHGWRRIAA